MVSDHPPCPKGDFYRYLKTTCRQSEVSASNYNCAIHRLMESGITEEELLYGDYLSILDKWSEEHAKISKTTSKTRYRSAIRKYRDFKGVGY